jgi:hypothetical protein
MSCVQRPPHHALTQRGQPRRATAALLLLLRLLSSAPHAVAAAGAQPAAESQVGIGDPRHRTLQSIQSGYGRYSAYGRRRTLQLKARTQKLTPYSSTRVSSSSLADAITIHVHAHEAWRERARARVCRNCAQVDRSNAGLPACTNHERVPTRHAVVPPNQLVPTTHCSASSIDVPTVDGAEPGGAIATRVWLCSAAATACSSGHSDHWQPGSTAASRLVNLDDVQVRHQRDSGL